MFKDRCYQGLYPYFITAMVLAVLGLSFLGYYLTHFGANQLLSQGRILDERTLGGNVAAQIIYISPKSVAITERGTELYLIGYADKDDNIGYIGMEAKKNDGHIKRLYQNNEHLIDQPYHLEVEVLKTSDYFDKKTFTSLTNQLLKPDSTLRKEISKTRLVSLTLANQNRLIFYLLFILSLILGIVALMIGINLKQQNSRSLKDFYDLYPEIDANLDKVKTYAHFNLEDSDLLIYQNHLLVYSLDIRLLPLDNINQLRLLKGKYAASYQKLSVTFNNTQKITIRLKPTVPHTDLEALWAYLNRYFKHIQTGSIVKSE